MVMFVTSDVRVLINYISFSGNLLALICMSTFFWFRLKSPDLPRPIKVRQRSIHLFIYSVRGKGEKLAKGLVIITPSVPGVILIMSFLVWLDDFVGVKKSD